MSAKFAKKIHYDKVFVEFRIIIFWSRHKPKKQLVCVHGCKLNVQENNDHNQRSDVIPLSNLINC